MGDSFRARGEHYEADYSLEELRGELKNHYPRWNGDNVKVGNRWVSFYKWIEDWEKLHEDIPLGLLMAAKQQFQPPGPDSPQVGVPMIRYSDTAESIMRSMDGTAGA